MIRKFKRTTDNNLTSLSYSIQVGSELTPETSGEILVETATPVYFAIVTESGVTTTSSTPNKGPYYISGTGSDSVYDLQSIVPSTTAASSSLQVYLNGQLLELGEEYYEIGDHQFSFYQLDDDLKGLVNYPSSTDIIGIVYRQAVDGGNLSGSEVISISAVYPEVSTGFKISYSDFSDGDVINLVILYG